MLKNKNMKTEILKTVCPVAGGLAIGDGIDRIFINGNMFVGITSIVLGIILSVYTIHLIYKK